MTENEAIKGFEMDNMLLGASEEGVVERNNIAIQALEEIQQYRAIGTVEEIKEVLSVADIQADKLNAYKKVGTIEEFKALKEKEHNYDNCHNLTCRRKCEKDGYAKAIDDFAELLKEKAEEILKNPDIMADCKKCTIWKARDIDEIAEQLKGGAG